MPIDKAAVGLSLLKDAMDAFIDNAMSRVRRSVSLEDHTPEAINYLSTVLGRDLPQPEPGSEPLSGNGDDDEDEDAGAFRQLGGEADAPPLAPPWFLPGAEAVWLRIADTERTLRSLVREVYTSSFGDTAAATIQRNYRSETASR